MKTFKIILGILLLYGSGTEYINASHQLGTYFSPGILVGCLLMISLSAWLIGSGISKEKLPLRSPEFVKYIFIAFVGFAIFAFTGLRSYKPAPDLITSNGVKVDIAAFMNGSRNIMPDEKERRQYCECVVNKLTRSPRVATRFSAEFRNGDIDKIIESVKGDPEFAHLNMNECMSSVTHFQWTETFEKSTRESLYQQVKNTELPKTNNIDIYCDCLVEEYKKLPLNEITSPEFPESSNFNRIDSLCNMKSKLK